MWTNSVSIILALLSVVLFGSNNANDNIKLIEDRSPILPQDSTLNEDHDSIQIPESNSEIDLLKSEEQFSETTNNIYFSTRMIACEDDVKLNKDFKDHRKISKKTKIENVPQKSIFKKKRRHEKDKRFDKTFHERHESSEYKIHPIRSKTDDILNGVGLSIDQVHDLYALKEIRNKITNLTNKAEELSNKVLKIWKDRLDVKNNDQVWDLKKEKEIEMSNISQISIENQKYKPRRKIFRSGINTKDKNAVIIVNTRSSYEKHRPEDNLEDSIGETHSNGLGDLKSIREKVDILRNIYGSACLRFVKKKCIQAMKKVANTVRSRHKFRSPFRSTFKTEYEKGCSKAFRYKEEKRDNDTDTNKKSSDKKKKKQRKYKVIRNTNEQESGEMDEMSAGRSLVTDWYLAMIGSSPSSAAQESITNDTVEILRDRYEKACVFENRKKCLNVCLNSLKKACDSIDTNYKSLESSFEKHCRRQCKEKFVYDDKKDSSSDSYSDSSDSS